MVTHEKGSEDVVLAICYTIRNIHISLTQTGETTSPEPFSWITSYVKASYFHGSIYLIIIYIIAFVTGKKNVKLKEIKGKEIIIHLQL